MKDTQEKQQPYNLNINHSTEVPEPSSASETELKVALSGYLEGYIFSCHIKNGQIISFKNNLCYQRNSANVIE